MLNATRFGTKPWKEVLCQDQLRLKQQEKAEEEKPRLRS
jgi:hypothetical protein